MTAVGRFGEELVAAQKALSHAATPLAVQSFGQKVGSAPKTEAALRSGLWTASSLLLKKDNITRRVLVFTSDDQPVTEKQGMWVPQAGGCLLACAWHTHTGVHCCGLIA